MPVKSVILSIIMLLVLLFNRSSWAHNGAVAIAFPVKGIVVDGDLKDWPPDAQKYPIALREYGVNPRDAQDFQGIFRLGYDARENALYIAVEVQDESTVIDTTAGARWDTQDGCEVYVDTGHGRDGFFPVQYTKRGRRDVNKVTALAGERIGPQEANAAVIRQGGRQIYEWRIDLSRIRKGDVHIHSGMSIGVDVAYCDKDNDGSFSWIAWGSRTAKFQSQDRIGDALLTDRKKGVGRLRGKVTWESERQAIHPKKIWIRDENSEALSTQVQVDQDGRFAVDLPEGFYRLRLSRRQGLGDEKAVAVRTGTTEEVEVLAKPPGPLRRKAGKGRKLEAGSGRRQQRWQIFGVSDGLPSSSINCIIQDRAGYIWFGTGGNGVYRFDGREFLNYTTKDGLIHDWVESIAEDGEGHFWFGTDGGVSRYDGRHFTSFSAETGLGEGGVISILQDREGILWLGTNGGGVSRYDGKAFTTFTTEHGLAGSVVFCITEDRSGSLWFGTWGGGVSRYDREGRRRLNDSQDRSPLPNPGEPSGVGTFTTFTAADGLAHNWVQSIGQDRDGNLWFGTNGGGVSRYDPRVKPGAGSSAGSGQARKAFTTFTTDDGLALNNVSSIAEDHDGSLWFGTRGGGVSHNDGAAFTTFTTDDGLAHNGVVSIYMDRERNLWVGSNSGSVSRYDGAFTTFTTADGLNHNNVLSIVEDREGNLLFKTIEGSVNRYDREERRRLNDSQDHPGRGTFTAFTTADGPARNRVASILKGAALNLRK